MFDMIGPVFLSENLVEIRQFIGGIFVTVLRIGYCIGADLHIVI